MRTCFHKASSGRLLFLVAFIAFPNLSVSAQENQPAAVTKKDDSAVKLPDVRNALAERVQKDQELRGALIKMSNQPNSNAQVDQSTLITQLTATDKANTEWLEKQIELHGWLGKSLVGKEAAHHAWLLVQHADRNPKFQKKCLRLMNEMPEGEVGPSDIAYLTDRVLMAEGKPQRYGTQCMMENGKAVVSDVEDRDNLNKRRAELGLPTIEEYLKQIDSLYGASKP